MLVPKRNKKNTQASIYTLSDNGNHKENNDQMQTMHANLIRFVALDVPLGHSVR